MKLVATSIKTGKKSVDRSVGVAVEQEDLRSVALVLTDTDGYKIPKSEFARVVVQENGKLKLYKIISRENLSEYLELDGTRIASN